MDKRMDTTLRLGLFTVYPLWGRDSAELNYQSARKPVSLQAPYRCIYIYMGGCQNYGPFLGPYYNTAPNI